MRRPSRLISPKIELRSRRWQLPSAARRRGTDASSTGNRSRGIGARLASFPPPRLLPPPSPALRSTSSTGGGDHERPPILARPRIGGIRKPIAPRHSARTSDCASGVATCDAGPSCRRRPTTIAPPSAAADALISFTAADAWCAARRSSARPPRNGCAGGRDAGPNYAAGARSTCRSSR